MTEQELRQLVRRVVAERLGGASPADDRAGSQAPLPLLDVRDAREPRDLPRGGWLRDRRAVRDRAAGVVQSLRVLPVDGALTVGQYRPLT